VALHLAIQPSKPLLDQPQYPAGSDYRLKSEAKGLRQ
jgi:hypothetical protein